MPRFSVWQRLITLTSCQPIVARGQSTIRRVDAACGWHALDTELQAAIEEPNRVVRRLKLDVPQAVVEQDTRSALRKRQRILDGVAGVFGFQAYGATLLSRVVGESLLQHLQG